MRIEKKSIIILSLIIFITIFFYYENNFIEYKEIHVESNRLPRIFDRYKIIHISDLHSKVFLNNNKSLVENIKKANADLIVITGDLIDRKNYDEDKSIGLIKQINDIAPIYYVTGNQEELSGKFQLLREKLKQNGVNILENDKKVIKRGKDEIVILGIDDPSRGMMSNKVIAANTELAISKNFINQSMKDTDNSSFKILLAHRPELFSLYDQEGIDVVLSGHAHGGQVWLPFIEGIFAPNQGFFPKYIDGEYEGKNSKMVVSRGLGNSTAPLRIFNRPEVIIITLGTSSRKSVLK